MLTLLKSNRLLQQLSVLLQPGFGLFHGRRLSANDVPESGGMVGLDEVGQFVDDNIINHQHGGFNQAPVEIDIVINGAGTPSVAIVDDLDFGNIDAEFVGLSLHPRDDLFFGLTDIPFP